MHIGNFEISPFNPNLSEEGNFIRWFSHNNSETVKAVTICAKFGMLNLLQSPDTAQNSDGGISDFQPIRKSEISGKRKVTSLQNQQ